MPIADFHQDTLNPQLAEILENPELDHARERNKQLPREGLAKLDLIFSSVYRRLTETEQQAATSGDTSGLEQLRADESALLDFYNASEDFRIITRPEDLHIERTPDAHSVVLHKEGGDIISDPAVVSELYERGVRSVGPLYNHDNQLGGGARGDKRRGLTDLGKRIIDSLMEKGMIIDIAHANRKTAQDILERVRNYEKIAATHTALGSSERMIDEKLLRAIADRGGVVGFTPNQAFFPSLEKFIETFKQASDSAGSAKHVAVGSDFGGVDADQLFTQLDNVGKMSVIAEKLSEEGHFTDDEIRDIMYGNIARIVARL